MGTIHRCVLAIYVFWGLLSGPMKAGGQTPGPYESLSPSPEHDVADCVGYPKQTKEFPAVYRAYTYFHNTNDSPSSPGYESFLYQRAIPNILHEHSQFEFFMYWKHIYGMNYGDPPPANNPMRATEEELDFVFELYVKRGAASGNFGLLAFGTEESLRRAGSYGQANACRSIVIALLKTDW